MLLVNIILAITVCVIGLSRAAPATTMGTSSTPQCPNVNGMTTIDTTKLMGLWYLVAMTPSPINQTCPLQCPRLTFSQSTSSTYNFLFTTNITGQTQPITIGLSDLPITPVVSPFNLSMDILGTLIDIQSMILNTDYTNYMLMYTCSIVNTTLVETFDVFGRQPSMASISAGTMNAIQQSIGSTTGLTNNEFYNFTQTC
ncbi:unnamed protein product [Medioppia subpectinata]|uniref:Lipocalin/cytosolic fatty-acid binding domain-containing protein n=1 Tax=Medioppia subpectinata TaxID=1979941 RepID=A0A7R9L305_9ACAR|nr:unnamed protein product [Medioppia subpectinata]CAG2114628.1 unnamed protein product [Medioppia subpectinata]